MNKEIKTGAWEYIKDDLATYYRKNGCRNLIDFIGILLFYPQLWAIIVYRIGHAIKRRWLYKLYLYFLWNPIRLITSIEIWPQATIGKNFFIIHFGDIIIDPKAVIGNDCLISGRCTIGLRFNDPEKEAPVLGDGVKVGIGAVMFGGIKIGNNSVIGANACVTKSVPDNSVVVSNTEVIIKKAQE